MRTRASSIQSKRSSSLSLCLRITNSQRQHYNLCAEHYNLYADRIPRFLNPRKQTQFIAETAKAHKVLSRSFSPKSHVAAMLYCQVSKTESLNSICDVARANDALWRSMGVTPPMRNTLSNANAQRPSGMAKDLCWTTFSHLLAIAPKFGRGPHRGYCFRIKAPMFAVDSSTIRLTVNSFDWARHRRSKVAAN